MKEAGESKVSCKESEESEWGNSAVRLYWIDLRKVALNTSVRPIGTASADHADKVERKRVPPAQLVFFQLFIISLDLDHARSNTRKSATQRGKAGNVPIVSLSSTFVRST
jgi:hypothetical protein